MNKNQTNKITQINKCWKTNKQKHKTKQTHSIVSEIGEAWGISSILQSGSFNFPPPPQPFEAGRLSLRSPGGPGMHSNPAPPCLPSTEMTGVCYSTVHTLFSGFMHSRPALTAELYLSLVWETLLRWHFHFKNKRLRRSRGRKAAEGQTEPQREPTPGCVCVKSKS